MNGGMTTAGCESFPDPGLEDMISSETSATRSVEGRWLGGKELPAGLGFILEAGNLGLGSVTTIISFNLDKHFGLSYS